MRLPGELVEYASAGLFGSTVIGVAGSDEPTRPVVDARVGRVRRGQIRVDVHRIVQVAVVDIVERPDEPPWQPAVDADVAAPRLGESEPLIRHVQLVAGGRAAGR